MKSEVEHNINANRHYQTVVVASLIHGRKRRQMTVGFTDPVPYAVAMRMATPLIEQWEKHLTQTIEVED